MSIAWIGFFLAIGVLLYGARHHLTLALLTGAIILGIFTLSPYELLEQIYITSTDPNIILLILALGIIPIIGGILQESGKLDDIINNLRVGKRLFLGSTPALLGLLPIPGGALFSAPLIDKAGEELEGHEKTSINVWFRHVLYFIYPISYALIIPADIANLSIYSIIIFQFPFFIMTIALGYLFLLRKVDGEMEYTSEMNVKALLPPLTVLIAAPVVHFVLFTFFTLPVENLSLLIAVSISLLLAIHIINDSKPKIIKLAVNEMKPWNFMILIFCLYLFINIFLSSGIDVLIENLQLPRVVLAVGFGFLLGLATGRIIIPASIIIPIYMASFTLETLPILIFSLIYLSVFMGYVITPVHPCISISLEYFDGDMGKFLKRVGGPVIISLIVATLLFIVFV